LRRELQTNAGKRTRCDTKRIGIYAVQKVSMLTNYFGKK